MASWTVITDAVLAIGQAVRSRDAKAIRDNITALAEGAPGAPKIVGDAIQIGTITGNNLANETIPANKLVMQSLASTFASGGVGALMYGSNCRLEPGASVGYGQILTSSGTTSHTLGAGQQWVYLSNNDSQGSGEANAKFVSCLLMRIS